MSTATEPRPHKRFLTLESLSPTIKGGEGILSPCAEIYRPAECSLGEIGSPETCGPMASVCVELMGQSAHPTTQFLCRQLGEEAVDQIEPAGASGYEVKVKARVCDRAA
jgi:hypothetical protein